MKKIFCNSYLIVTQISLGNNYLIVSQISLV